MHAIEIGHAKRDFMYAESWGLQSNIHMAYVSYFIF